MWLNEEPFPYSQHLGGMDRESRQSETVRVAVVPYHFWENLCSHYEANSKLGMYTLLALSLTDIQSRCYYYTRKSRHRFSDVSELMSQWQTRQGVALPKLHNACVAYQNSL